MSRKVLCLCSSGHSAYTSSNFQFSKAADLDHVGFACGYRGRLLGSWGRFCWPCWLCGLCCYFGLDWDSGMTCLHQPFLFNLTYHRRSSFLIHRLSERHHLLCYRLHRMLPQIYAPISGCSHRSWEGSFQILNRDRRSRSIWSIRCGGRPYSDFED